MSSVRVRHNLPVVVKREEMARILGYPDSSLPSPVEAMVGEITSMGGDLVEPRCSYRLLPPDELPPRSYLSGAEPVYLCLVTIGGNLERKVEELKRRGDLTRALVLDTYGSAAAEASADAAEAVIAEEAQWTFNPRFSPGYGSWALEEQRWILPALQAEKLGVSLTEGCMMVPRKSITFALTPAPPGRRRREDGACRVCGMENCRFRHQQLKEES